MPIYFFLETIDLLVTSISPLAYYILLVSES